MDSMCHENPCQNGGTCVSISSFDYTCLCPFETRGRNCEVWSEGAIPRVRVGSSNAKDVVDKSDSFQMWMIASVCGFILASILGVVLYFVTKRFRGNVHESSSTTSAIENTNVVTANDIMLHPHVTGIFIEERTGSATKATKLDLGEHDNAVAKTLIHANGDWVKNVYTDMNMQEKNDDVVKGYESDFEDIMVQENEDDEDGEDGEDDDDSDSDEDGNGDDSDDTEETSGEDECESVLIVPMNGKVTGDGAESVKKPQSCGKVGGLGNIAVNQSTGGKSDEPKTIVDEYVDDDMIIMEGFKTAGDITEVSFASFDDTLSVDDDATDMFEPATQRIPVIDVIKAPMLRNIGHKSGYVLRKTQSGGTEV